MAKIIETKRNLLQNIERQRGEINLCPAVKKGASTPKVHFCT